MAEIIYMFLVIEISYLEAIIGLQFNNYCPRTRTTI